MSPEPGAVIARGTRSCVRAYGTGAVIKIPDAATPGRWITDEARYTEAVREAGAPAPRLLAVEQVDGRPASVWERVEGPSLWEAAVREPARSAEYGALLAELQLALFELAPPLELPRQRDRLAAKIRRAARLVDGSLADALELLPPVARHPRVCHGDLHPGNVLLSADGPVVVDWFDASQGDPAGDVARSSLLTAHGEGDERPRHLPGALAGPLAELAEAHLAGIRARLELPGEQFARWRAVEAVARMAEEVAPGPLLALWRGHEQAAAQPG